MARELEQRRVQVGVRVRRAEEVASLEQLALARQTRPQTCDAGVVDALGGLANGEPLQDGAGLQDLDRLLVRDLPHARAAMRLANDEPFLLEPDERSSHRAARHLEGRADLHSTRRALGAMSPRTIASRSAS